MPPKDPDPFLPEVPEDPETDEVRAERAWMASHRFTAWPLERAWPCVRPATPADLRDATSVLVFRDRKARLGLFLASVLARPPAHGRQQLVGVVDRSRLASGEPGSPAPFPVIRPQPAWGADGRPPAAR